MDGCGVVFLGLIPLSKNLLIFNSFLCFFFLFTLSVFPSMTKVSLCLVMNCCSVCIVYADARVICCNV